MHHKNLITKKIQESNKKFIISHNNFSGEFRYNILPSDSTLYWIQKNHSQLIKELNSLPYFYSLREAVRFCEENHFLLES